MRRERDVGWSEVLEAAVRLQRLVPEATLVGGTAASLFAHHRVSFVDDHVLADLRVRFDTVLADLEASRGWVTARVNRPVLILGSLDGVDTGIRQLIRRRPLEMEIHETPAGPIRVPSLSEMLRIKGWLVLRRNATRDYLDVVALADRVGDAAPAILVDLDHWYADQIGPHGARVATQLARQLAEPRPYDLSAVDLNTYRELSPRWRDWTGVEDACRRLAVALLDEIVGDEP